MWLIFLLPALVVAPPPPEGEQGNGCFPPQSPNPNNCGELDWNPNYSCVEGVFNLTSGRWFGCLSHQDCYGFREPNEWCHLPLGAQWTETGCFCDPKIGACIIERLSPSQLEWAYCMPENQFICDIPSGECY